MTRLVHSENGFIRSLEISTINFFAFVEGGLDRAFYDRLLELNFDGKNIKHEVIAAKELPGETGGKIRLLALFKQLRSKSKLASNSFGKRFACVFFFDKDVDDLKRTKIRSNHCIYTEGYDLEGHLFTCGDLHRAIADACGITKSQANSLIGDQSIWLQSCVARWKEWVTLCLMQRVEGVNCGCTYERVSDLNANLINPTDLNKLVYYQNKLQILLNLNSTNFKKLYKRYEDKITQSIINNKPLSFFKGKWLRTLIELDLGSRNQIPNMSLNGAGERVVSTLVSQVGNHVSCRCCGIFSPKILKIAHLV